MSKELPGHAAAVLPIIDRLAGNADERALLIELAKSHVTREWLTRAALVSGQIIVRVEYEALFGDDPALKKRLDQALDRYRKARKSA